MRKYIFTEEQIKKVIDGMINEQAQSNKFNVPATSNKVTIPSVAPTTKIDTWKGFADYAVSLYDYTMENQNKLTYTMDNKLTITITFEQYDANPAVGAIGINVTFIDPNIVKVNGPVISKIASTLGVKLANNSIVANKPQGYLTQVVNTVAKMLYNNVKIDGATISQIEGQKIKKEVMGQSY